MPSREILGEVVHLQVPAHVTDHNRGAYQPLAVSFGPSHYGEDHLLPMEEHKSRALHRFFTRSGKPLQRFLESLREVAGDLEASYVALDLKWKEDGGEGAVCMFLQLMITDGCFMLEILRFATYRVSDYGPNDPIFSNYGMVYIMQHIRRDMLVLENQLPMQVLDQLVAVESDGHQVTFLDFASVIREVIVRMKTAYYVHLTVHLGDLM
ncbi:hypothetical protein NL676_005589 [Syzygium grande]|nr:hypothetical protein NL676_005589 [Syzygium grande]